jgi:ubiquinone/menaquinone biosynthesis C-methylase UbiE
MDNDNVAYRSAGYELAVIKRGDSLKELQLTATSPDLKEIPEHLRSCQTNYDFPLIEAIFRQKKLWTCDEIRRDTEPEYVERLLYHTIVCHVLAEQVNGSEILDFGCGAGASTVILKRLFPQAVITGVDMDRDLLNLANERKRFYGLDDLHFIHSTDPYTVPVGNAKFDYIILNAVYEHLLKRERRLLLPVLWHLLKKDGVIFINETPNRWFNRETHTTQLKYINYLPDFLAYPVVRQMWNYYSGENWHRLLKDGIRGGSMGEIRRIFKRSGCTVAFLKPDRLGVHNRLDLFYRVYSIEEYIGNPEYMRKKLRMLLTGYVDTSALILAIQKVGPELAAH